MLKVIHRISYCSFLALYLFAHTPVPAGISEDEELDGMSAQVCMQTAMYQLQRLRERRKAPEATPQSIDLENRAFWVAMVWDTSSSLVSGARTSLSSGLNGACAEPTWRLVRAFLIGSFQARSEAWHHEDYEISEDNAYEVIAAGSISKTYIWKTITSFKEALREGVHDNGVSFAWNALLDTIDIWYTLIRALLLKCERRLLFLSQRVRLNWYNLSVQFHLGILHLTDALETASRSDLLLEITRARQDAKCTSFNVLKFGLENPYVCPQRSDAEPLISASITAVDPYPEYALDLVLLLEKGLRRKQDQGEITSDMYAQLRSILHRTLEELSQSSKAVCEAQERF